MPKKKWYFTCPLSLQQSPIYELVRGYILEELPVINPGENELVEARGKYTSGKDWLEKWQTVVQDIDGGCFFSTDTGGTGHIGRGVYTEVFHFLGTLCPVYLVTNTGVIYPITTFVGPAFLEGPDFTNYQYIDVEVLEKKFQEEEEMNKQEEKENALLLALCQEAGSEGTREELIGGARANHHPEDIRNAANGDIASLVQLRRDFGLPVIV